MTSKHDLASYRPIETSPYLKDLINTVPQLYEQQAQSHPNYPLFVYQDPDGRLVYISLSTAVAAMHRAAHLIAARLPASLTRKALGGHPSVVAILAATGKVHSSRKNDFSQRMVDAITFMTTQLGIMRAGLTVFMISPRNSPEAIAHLLRGSGVRHLLVEPTAVMQTLANQSLDLIRASDATDEEKSLEYSDMPVFQELYLEAPQSNLTTGEYPAVKVNMNAPTLILHSSGSVTYTSRDPRLNADN